MSMRITIRCPHCRARATAVKSREMTLTMREVTYVCTNAHCGHTYVAGLEVMRTLSPSAMPNPAVTIPLSMHIKRRLLAAQMDGAPTAAATDADAQAEIAARNLDLFPDAMPEQDGAGLQAHGP